MKILKKIALSLIMAGALTFGFNQLSVAASGTCPAYSCEELYWCDLGMTNLGTCHTGYESQWIYPVEACHVTTCYGDYEW